MNSITELYERLFELEKKLDAFRSLQDDELSEMKSILVHIRQDLHTFTQSTKSISSSRSHDEAVPSLNDGDESVDDPPIFAL